MMDRRTHPRVPDAPPPGGAGTRRRPLRLAAGLAAGILLLSGCSTFREILDPGSGGPQAPAPVRAERAPRADAVVCVDWSGSYPSALRARALRALAGQLQGLAHPGSGGARIYLRAISSNSYQDRAALMRIDLPPVPPEPAPPDLESAPLESNRLLAEYVAKRREARAALRRAQAEARRQARALRRLRYPVSRTTDVMGCVQRASELLRGAGGERRLILFSDLRRVGTQQLGSRHRLDGVEVVVAFFPCEEALRCERLRAEWRGFFDRVGARAVRFATPGEPVDLFGRGEGA